MGFPDIILAKYRGWSQTLQAPAELAAVPAQPDVFPNPTTGRVTLRAAQPLTGQLMVRDMLGRVLLRQSVLGTPSISCSLADWPPGLYLLTFAEPNRTRTWRVMKEQEK